MGDIRIIGGKWRGRKIHVLDSPGLRPTHDRIRETLFNWLQGQIVGSHCLDLFAGSGVLSFEALSRGAKRVVSLDSSWELITEVKKTASSMGVSKEELLLLRSTFPANPFSTDCKKFDLIFLDPPYEKFSIDECLNWIVENNLIKESGKVYFECKNDDKIHENDYKMQIIKDSKTKTIRYGLLSFCGNSEEDNR